MFTSGHFIPYILMEWNLITTRHKASLCPHLDTVISLLKSAGYIAINLSPLGRLSDECLHGSFTDILWVHTAAKQLWDKDIDHITCV